MNVPRLNWTKTPKKIQRITADQWIKMARLNIVQIHNIITNKTGRNVYWNVNGKIVIGKEKFIVNKTGTIQTKSE